MQDRPTQKMICVDSTGRDTGRVVDRKDAHTAPGIKHLAIQIVVFNSKKEIILHERALKKVGGGSLDSPTTHVLAGERPIEAATRCLKDEYGIVGRLDIKILNGFSYEKEYGDGSCENEFCLVAYLVYDGIIVPSKEEVSFMVNIPARRVVQEMVSSPEGYTVWFKESLAIVKANPQAAYMFS